MKLRDWLVKQRSVDSANERDRREAELRAAERRAAEIKERSQRAAEGVKKHVPRDPWTGAVTGIARRGN